MTVDLVPDEPSGVRSVDATKAWWPHSLASGAVGAAILHIERAHRGVSDWKPALAWLAAAVGKPIAVRASGGLFEGGPAVAFAVYTADRPMRAREALDRYVADLTRRRLQAAHARIAADELATITEYDLIYGLTGIGSFLLRHERHHGVLREVLSYLVALTKPMRVDGRTYPGWWTRAAPAAQSSPAFPRGHGNFGMAHGIAGPLALLALAKKQGVVVAEHDAAIGAICTWLDEWRHDDGRGPWWPEWITEAELRDGGLQRSGPHRPSWCYGTPGLARAQQLAALATGDTGRRRMAENAFARCLSDHAQLDRVTDGTICHGTAGLFQTAWRAAADAADSAISAHLPQLHAMLDHAMPAAPSGQNIGILNGAAGIALARHTAESATAPSSGWDACLLIA